ncbi:hypothetical protein ACFX10_017874 [Malus domestica]
MCRFKPVQIGCRQMQIRGGLVQITDEGFVVTGDDVGHIRNLIAGELVIGFGHHHGKARDVHHLFLLAAFVVFDKFFDQILADGAGYNRRQRLPNHNQICNVERANDQELDELQYRGGWESLEKESNRSRRFWL